MHGVCSAYGLEAKCSLGGDERTPLRTPAGKWSCWVGNCPRGGALWCRGSFGGPGPARGLWASSFRKANEEEVSEYRRSCAEAAPEGFFTSILPTDQSTFGQSRSRTCSEKRRRPSRVSTEGPQGGATLTSSRARCPPPARHWPDPTSARPPPWRGFGAVGAGRAVLRVTQPPLPAGAGAGGFSPSA